MASKPPKGITEKLPFVTDDAEIIWYLLQTVEGFETVESQHWDALAFGLLGGIDIAHHSNLLKDRPPRIQIQVHRTSIQQFCRTLQLGFEEYPLSRNTNPHEVFSLLEMVPNLFLKNRFGIWKIVLSNGDWWGVNLTGKSWNQSSFSPNRGDLLIAIEDVSSLNLQEVLHLVLSEHTAHFTNATGVHAQITVWKNHLRRASLRKSWSSMLVTPYDYYWSALQVYYEIHLNSDIAYRELYIRFLLCTAELLDCDSIRGLAIKFRSSANKWLRLSTLLLEGESKSLSKIPELSWIDFETVHNLATVFGEESMIDNVTLRLQTFESILHRLYLIEKEFFIDLSETLSGLVFGSNWASDIISND